MSRQLFLAVAPVMLWGACSLDLDKRTVPLDDLTHRELKPLVPLDRSPVDGVPRLADRGAEVATVVDLMTPDTAPGKDKDGDGLPDDVDPDPTHFNTVYYYQPVGTHVADYTVTAFPSPTPKGNDLCSDVPAGGLIALLKQTLPSSDYLIVASFSVTWTNPIGTPQAGVDFRVTGGNSYQCRLNFKQGQLELASGNFMGWSPLGQPAPAKAADPYLLVVRAVGDKLECSVTGQTATVSATDPTYKNGGVALAARDVSVCFHYLIIVAAGAGS